MQIGAFVYGTGYGQFSYGRRLETENGKSLLRHGPFYDSGFHDLCDQSQPRAANSLRDCGRTPERGGVSVRGECKVLIHVWRCKSCRKASINKRLKQGSESLHKLTFYGKLLA